MFGQQNSENFIGRWMIVSVVAWVIGYFSLRGVIGGSTFHSTQLLFSRIGLLICIVPLVINLTKRINVFVKRKGSAKNLAVFRIIFFGFFVIGLPFGYTYLYNRTMLFATMPDSAIVPLPIFQPIINLLPIGVTMVNIVLPLFALSVVGSCVGFKTRYSIALFVLTTLFIFGIPNMFGKVNHNHHIVWIGFILMLSPCGDVLSIDSRLANKINKPAASIKYGMPFAIIWLMMGVIYFFPGFWKVWTSGLDWVFTENVRNHMYWKWFELTDWMPFFRFDQYSWAYKSAGLFTILFELFFIFLVVSERYRKWAIIGGLMFHLGTLLSLNIFFVMLFLAYASFINWDRLNKKKVLNEESTQPIVSKKKESKLMYLGGLGLIMILILFGSFKILSWPFSVYPLFDQMVGTEIKTLQFESVESNGDTIIHSKDKLKTNFSSERYRSLEYQIIHAYENGLLNEQIELMTLLTENMRTDSNSILVSILTTSAIPEQSSHPTTKELVYKIDGLESNR